MEQQPISELENGEAVASQALRALPGLVLAIDRRGICVLCAGQAMGDWGFHGADWIGHPLHSLCPDRQLAQGLLDGLAGTPSQFDLHLAQRSYACQVQPLRDESARISGALAHLTEVTRFHVAETRLRDSEQRFRHLCEFLPQAVYETDRAGYIKYANLFCLELFGYSREDADQGMHVTQYLAPECRERAAQQFHLFCQGKGKTGNEYEAVRKDGTRFPIVIHSSLVHDAQGKVTGLRGILADITDRKHLEAEQQARELRSQRLNEALAALSSNQSLFKKDTLTAFQLVTETVTRALEVRRASVWLFREDRTALICQDLYDAHECAHAQGMLLERRDYPVYFEALEKGRLMAMHDAWGDPRSAAFGPAYLDPAGITSMLDTPIHLSGRLIGVVCHEHVGPQRIWSEEEQGLATAVASHVSSVIGAHEQRRAEEELRQAHCRLNDIIEFLPDATLVIDQNRRVVAWNRAIEAMTGVPKEAMLGKGDFEYALPFYGQRRPLLIDLAFVPESELRLKYDTIHADGHSINGEVYVPETYGGRGAYLQGSASLLYDEQGAIAGAIESIRDVTDRKRAEQAMSAWRERYELVTAASGQITFEYRPLEDTFLWSPVLERVLGYLPSELQGGIAVWSSLIHPDDRAECVWNLNQSLQGIHPLDVECRFKHKNGEYLWFRDRGYYSTEPNQPVCMIGMMTDITKRKLAENRLRRRLRYEEGVAKCSRLLIGEAAHGQPLPQSLQALLEASDTSCVTVYENEVGLASVGKSVAVLQVNRHGEVTPAGPEGAPPLRESLAPDCCRELAACKTMVKGPDAATAAPALLVPLFVGHYWFGFMRFDCDSGQRSWDEEDSRMLALAAEVIGQFIARQRIEEELRKAHAELENRVFKRTEELAAANLRLRQEMREREQAQVALSESERRYQEALEALPQTVFECNPYGQITYLNQAGKAALGYDSDDLAAGLNLVHIVEKAQRIRIDGALLRLRAGQLMQGGEYGVLRKDHTSFVAELHARLVTRRNLPPVISGFLVDVTARKQAEEELRRAHAELEQRVLERTNELATSNVSLRRLLDQQQMNISLAQRVLGLIDAGVPRHTPLPFGGSLFIMSDFIPCHAEGGDHFLVRTLPAGGNRARRTVVSVKDQSGHEVGCILRSIATDLMHNALLVQADPAPPLEEVMSKINDQICLSHLFGEDDFFTSINLELDHQTLQLRYVSTGHPPFLLIRGSAVHLLPGHRAPGSNLPVGVCAHKNYTAGEVRLAPGDKLILYTDGFLDASRRSGRHGMKATELCELAGQIAAVSPGLPVSQMVLDLFQRISGMTLAEARRQRGFVDDIAVLALEIEAPACILEDQVAPQSEDELYHWRKRLFGVIRREWNEHGIELPDQRLRIAFEEMVLNAWHHGNRRTPGKRIHVRRAYGNDALLEVWDEGDGFDFARVHDPTACENITRPSGRGLFVIRKMADAVHWEGRGNRVKAFFGCHAGNRSARRVSTEWINLWQPAARPEPTATNPK